METRNRKRRRPSVKLHQHPSQNLPGTSQQPRQLPSTQMPDQLPPNQQPVQLPPNQQPVQLPPTPSHRLGQWSSNQQSGHQPDQLPLSQQLGDQMQPAASQPDPAVQSGNSFTPKAQAIFTDDLQQEANKLLDNALAAYTKKAYIVGLERFSEFKRQYGLSDAWPPTVEQQDYDLKGPTSALNPTSSGGKESKKKFFRLPMWVILQTMLCYI
ncbi:hypothetical protein DPMN_178733 [Dreissena polymorpha]|uniref:Uncharacterized protein n=1 Tax=Dreissena polymorpha TaxID=45954 RepID=A0A9D4ECS4_DREPO|nr:hypothetical protein DPMN_178733 [Dreissena polymorpha]